MKKTKQIAANAGLLGIVVNSVLFGIKLSIGLISGSVSILSDAFNNLSDFLSALIAFVGFKLGQKPADRKYPYGYERFEYISGFLISMIMLTIGIEVFKNSFEALQKPKPIQLNGWMILVLIISIVIKLVLFIYYRDKNKSVDSEVLSAVSYDSLMDVLTSTTILLAYFISVKTGLYLDGYLGLAMSLVIVATSIKMIVGFIRDLVGRRPSEARIKVVTDILDNQEGILGYHDLLIHEYGDETAYGSVHIELDDRLSLTIAHQISDRIERDLLKTSQVEMVIHLDPIDITSSKIKGIHYRLKRTLKGLDSRFSFHDLRLDEDVIEFDIEMFEGCSYEEKELLTILEETFQGYKLNIVFDYHSLIDNS